MTSASLNPKWLCDFFVFCVILCVLVCENDCVEFDDGFGEMETLVGGSSIW